MNGDQKEAIAVAVVEESSKGSDKAKEIGGIMRGKKDAGESWQDTVEAGQVQFDFIKTVETIQKIGWERNPDGTKKITPGSAEEIRLNKALDAAQKIQLLLAKGLDCPELTGDRDRIIDSIIEQSKSFGEMGKTLKGLSRKEKEAFVKRVIASKGFRERCRESLAASNGRTFTDVEQFTTRLQEKTIEYDTKKGESDDADRTLARVEGETESFERKVDGTPVKTTGLAKDVDDLKADRNTNKTIVNEQTEKITKLNQRLDSLKGLYNKSQRHRDDGKDDAFIVSKGLRLPDDYLTGADSIDSTEKDINTERDKLQKAQESLRRLAELEEQEATLPTRRNEISNQARIKKAELAKVDLELNSLKAQLSDAKVVREAQEEMLAEDLQTLLDKAAAGMINEQVMEMIPKYEQATEEVKQKTEEAQGKDRTTAADAAGRYLVERWNTRLVGSDGSLGAHAIRSDAVNADYDLLIKDERGAYKLMLQVLKKTRNPLTNAVYNDVEAKKFLENEQFKNDFQKKLITELFAYKLMSGSIPKDDLRIIDAADWGKELRTEAAQKADASVKEASTHMTKSEFSNFIVLGGIWNVINHFFRTAATPITVY